MSEIISLNEEKKITKLDDLLNTPNILTKEEEEEEEDKKEKIINENSEIKITSISSSEQYKKALDEKNKNTINEPIRDTIKRDLYLIWTKLKYVINPFVKEKDRNKHIKQWDLWGPLIFTILLSFTLAIKSNEKSDMFILIFMIFWFGSFLIYFNINLLGLNIGFFQIYCLLGYCLFPLNISAFILAFNFFYEIFRILILGFCLLWSCFSMIGFLKNLCNDELRGLVLYPAFLLYLFISGVILMNRF